MSTTTYPARVRRPNRAKMYGSGLHAMSWCGMAQAESPRLQRSRACEIGSAACIGRNVIPRVRPPVCCVQYAGHDGDMPAIPACTH